MKVIKRNKYSQIIAKKISRLRIKYRKPILGKNNTIKNNGELVNVKFDIKGDNNTLEFMQGSYLKDIVIFIRGNNHNLKVKENCRFKGGSFWFEDSNCLIEIGRDTTIESAHIAVI